MKVCFHPTPKTTLLTEEIVIDYVDTCQNRPVRSTVTPGYLKELLPDHAPEDGEKWEEIQKDIELKVMPGMNHWYYPVHFLDQSFCI